MKSINIMEGGEVQGKEKMILLRLLSTDTETRTYNIGSDKDKDKDKEVILEFNRERYCLLDLSSNPTRDEDIVLHDMPLLLDTLRQENASLVVEPKRQTIYLFGGKERDGYLLSIIESINSKAKSQPAGFASDFYTGASRLDFKDFKQTILQSKFKDNGKQPIIGHSSCWVPMPSPPFPDRWCTLCTTLDGCIYNLGSRLVLQDVPYVCPHTGTYTKFSHHYELNERESSFYSDLLWRYRKLCKPMVFNPDNGCWVELDSGGHEGFIVSAPLLPDPVNKRILVHFPMIKGTQSTVSRLYAFHPHKPKGENWVYLDCPYLDRHPWMSASAVVDNVIYFRKQDKPLVDAYDMVDGKWLEVKWSDVPLYEFDGVAYNAAGGELNYLYMLLLANNIFCLIANQSMYLDDDDLPSVIPTLLKFSFERKGDTVILTPMCTRVIVIRNTIRLLSCAAA